MKPRGETSGRSEEAAVGITNPVPHIQPPLPREQPGAPGQHPTAQPGSHWGGLRAAPGTAEPSPPLIHLISAGSRLPIICVDLPLIWMPALPSIPTALPHFLK